MPLQQAGAARWSSFRFGIAGAKFRLSALASKKSLLTYSSAAILRQQATEYDRSLHAQRGSSRDCHRT